MKNTQLLIITVHNKPAP